MRGRQFAFMEDQVMRVLLIFPAIACGAMMLGCVWMMKRAHPSASGDESIGSDADSQEAGKEATEEVSDV